MKYPIIIAALGILVSVIIYSNGVTKRQNDRFAREDTKNIYIRLCRREAKEAYNKWWNDECLAMGREEDCVLPEFNVNRMDKYLKEELDRCE